MSMGGAAPLVDDSARLNGTGLAGVSIAWKRGWTHGEGHQPEHQPQHPIGSDMGRGPSGEAVEELPILQGLDPLASLPPHRRVALTHTQIRRARYARGVPSVTLDKQQ